MADTAQGMAVQLPDERPHTVPALGEAQNSGNFLTLPRKVVLAMGLGSLGVSTLVTFVGLRLNTFYLAYTNSASEDESDRLTSSRFLGVLLVTAVIAAAARVLKVPASVLAAAMGRSHKRTLAMTVTIVPIAIAFLLSFVPTSSVAYVAIVHVVLGALVTGYLVPFHALASDLGVGWRDRLYATMWMSKCWGLGVAACFLINVGVYLIRVASFTNPNLEPSDEDIYSSVFVSAVFSGAAMTAPYFLIDEAQYRPEPASAPPPVMSSIRACLENPFFRPVVVIDAVSTFATSFLLTSLLFYSTAWPEEDGDAVNFDGIIYLELFVLVSIVMYWVVHFVAAQGNGGKSLLIFASIASCVTFALLSALMLCGAEDYNIFWVMLVWAFPYATLESVPLWLTADISKHHHLKTGEDIAPMYSAMRLSFRAVAGAAGPFVAAPVLNATFKIDEFDDYDYSACIIVVAAVAAGLYAATGFAVGYFDEATLRTELQRMEGARASRDDRIVTKALQSSDVLKECTAAPGYTVHVDALELES